MLLLHHLYNYLQTNLTIPKVHEIMHPSVLHDLQEIEEKEVKEVKEVQVKEVEVKEVKDELKEYMNQFKKK
jgi:hypothetical protein